MYRGTKNSQFLYLGTVLDEPVERSVFEIPMFWRKDEAEGMDEGREAWSGSRVVGGVRVIC